MRLLRGRGGAFCRTAALLLAAAVLLGSCIDQSGGRGGQGLSESAENGSELPKEGNTEGGSKLSKKESAERESGVRKEESEEDRGEASSSPRIVATSPATVEIMARLNLSLVGVPESSLSSLPSRYSAVTRVGTAMGPDMEIIKTLKPDYVIGPASLEKDMEPKLRAAGLRGIFLNLESVEGLYKSVEELGALLGREEEAERMVDEFSAFYYAYQKEHAGRESPSVLILMGLPGSYVVATGKSYVGSLVRLAGGRNVYEDEAQDFIVANTEDMQRRDPDIILRAAHALPEDVEAMFRQEFETNEIWRHFRAVEDGCVYDLPYQEFGMSAKFNFPAALRILEPMLYGE